MKASEIKRLDLTQTRQTLSERDPERLKRELEALQVAVYTMIGGGFLGRSASESPKQFYIDERVSRLPYPDKAILQAVKVLTLYAEVLGLDPNNLPQIPNFHNCGVF